MQSADHDDDLQLYVAAFRDVEQPTAAARAATWRAIDRETAASPRRWLWIGAAAMLAAAVWLVFRVGGIELAILGADEPDASHDQAGYLPDEEEASIAEARRRETPVERSSAPAIAPVAAAPVVEAPVVVEAPKRRTDVARPAPTLAEETKLFAEIQQALVAGQPKSALAAISRHQREFPRGAFRLERDVAKAQALCAAGDRRAAVRVREQFLAKHGKSHLAPRMRAVCPD